MDQMDERGTGEKGAQKSDFETLKDRLPEKDREILESSERFYMKPPETIMNDAFVERCGHVSEMLGSGRELDVHHMRAILQSIVLDHNALIFENMRHRRDIEQANHKIWELVKELLLTNFKQPRRDPGWGMPMTQLGRAVANLQVGFNK